MSRFVRCILVQTFITGIKNLPSCRVELDITYTNKDGEDLQPSDWTTVRGSFTSVTYMPTDQVDGDGYWTSSIRNPTLELTFMPDATRMDMIKLFYSMMKQMNGEGWVLPESMYSAPFRQVKIKAVNPEDKVARLLNVDGEPISLDNPEVDIRLLHKLLPIYSRNILK